VNHEEKASGVGSLPPKLISMAEEERERTSSAKDEKRVAHEGVAPKKKRLKT